MSTDSFLQRSPSNAAPQLSQEATPVTLVDLGSLSERMHMWPARHTERQLSNYLMLMHGSRQWETQRWCLCAATDTNTSLMHDQAPQFRCRPMMERLNRPGVNRSSPAEVLAFFARERLNWTYCDATGARSKAPRTVLRNRKSTCSRERNDVLHSCQDAPLDARV